MPFFAGLTWALVSGAGSWGPKLPGPMGRRGESGQWVFKGARLSIRKARHYNPTHGKLVRGVLESMITHLINFIHLEFQQCVEVLFWGRRSNLFLSMHLNRKYVIQVDIVALT